MFDSVMGIAAIAAQFDLTIKLDCDFATGASMLVSNVAGNLEECRLTYLSQVRGGLVRLQNEGWTPIQPLEWAGETEQVFRLLYKDMSKESHARLTYWPFWEHQLR